MAVCQTHTTAPLTETATTIPAWQLNLNLLKILITTASPVNGRINNEIFTVIIRVGLDFDMCIRSVWSGCWCCWLAVAVTTKRRCYSSFCAPVPEEMYLANVAGNAAFTVWFCVYKTILTHQPTPEPPHRHTHSNHLFSSLKNQLT